MDAIHSSGERAIVVCGLGRFGLLVVEHLRAAGRTVTVISDERTSPDRVERAVVAGARVMRGDFGAASVRREAGVDGAAAVVLATADDLANLETALEVRGEAPGVAVVMRHSEPRFARRFERDFGITAMASECLAADAFVEAALAPPPATAVVREATATERIPWRPLRSSFVLVPAAVALLYLLAVVVFRTSLGLGWIDAAYFTSSIMTTVGFGDFNLRDAPAGLKIFGIVLMFSGLVLIAILSSLLTMFIVTGTADQLRNEFRARRLRGHVVVCGLGHVGLAVARDLLGRGVPVVVVDPEGDDEPHRELHMRCPVIVGDAKRPAVLARAGTGRARALVACTSNDALNLEIGLAAQSLGRAARRAAPLRLVLRCFDADLARRIHAVSSDYTLLSEARIAAPRFAAAALGRPGGAPPAGAR